MDPTHVAERGERRDDAERHAVEERHGHPGPAEYVKVAIWLAIATAIEIALYYVTGLPDPAVTFLLLFLMVVKFVLVALWFMHLKFDSRTFMRLFAAGLAIAVTVFAVVLVTFGVFFGS